MPLYKVASKGKPEKPKVESTPEMWTPKNNPEDTRTNGFSLDQIRQLVAKKNEIEQQAISDMPSGEQEKYVKRVDNARNNIQKNWDKGVRSFDSEGRMTKDYDNGALDALKYSYSILGFNLGRPQASRSERTLFATMAGGVKNAVKKMGGTEDDAKELYERLSVFNQDASNQSLKPRDKERKFLELTQRNAKSDFLKQYAGAMKNNAISASEELGLGRDEYQQVLQMIDTDGNHPDIHPAHKAIFKDFYKNKENFLSFMDAIGALTPQELASVGLNPTARSGIGAAAQRSNMNSSDKNKLMNAVQREQTPASAARQF